MPRTCLEILHHHHRHHRFQPPSPLDSGWIDGWIRRALSSNISTMLMNSSRGIIHSFVRFSNGKGMEKNEADKLEEISF